MHKRSKHFEVDFHFVRERVASGSLIFHHIPGTQQLADIFTKSLSTKSFQDSRFKLGVFGTPTQSLRGHVDRRDKERKIWRPKTLNVSESDSVSETEKKTEVGLERDKVIRAETSYVNNEMDLFDTRKKPTQIKNEATATKTSEIRNRAKDKCGGPAVYEPEAVITLRNRFDALESNKDQTSQKDSEENN